MELLSKTRLLCLVAVYALLSLSSCFSASEFDEHTRRIIRSDEVDGYDIATVHAVDTVTNTETGLTKRDIEIHASDSSSNERRFSLQLDSGEKLRMSLQRRSVDTSGLTLTELTKEGKREIIHVTPRDCYFSGVLEKEEGFASVAMCGGKLAGSVTTTKRDYEIYGLPEPISKRSTDDVMQVLVTWQDRMARSTDNIPDITDDGIEIPEDETEFGDDAIEIPEGEERRRSVDDRQMTIEVGDYVDQHFLREMADKFNITTNDDILNALLIKWAGVAGVMSDTDRLGWNVTMKLVHVEIMRTDPSWYVTSSEDKMGHRLKAICIGTKPEKYDQLTLHTGKTVDRNKVGLAYVKGFCKPRWRCGVSRASNTKFRVETHELGHNLGLGHDGSMKECQTDADTQKGFMGKSTSFIPECYKQRLAKTIPTAKGGCIFKDAFTNVVGEWN